MNLPSEYQHGFITSDIKKLLPELVSIAYQPTFDSIGGVVKIDSFEVLNYIGMISILASSVNELSAQVNDLQSQLDGCCSTKMKTANDDGGSPANQVVELKTDASNYLGQSVPNPHGSQCTIPYSIDANVINAEIVFVDELGRVVQSVEIVTRGKGQLTVLSSNLEDGVYNYSLVFDGKIIDSKRMIQQH